MATDEDVALILDEARSAMEKTIQSLKKDSLRVRTGRASTALLDGVMVDYYGTPTPLQQLANITVADAQLLVAQPFDADSLIDYPVDPGCTSILDDDEQTLSVACDDGIE